MLEYLRDPAWQAVGVLVGAVVALGIYLLQRQRKALSYEVVTSIPLLTMNEKNVSGLEMSFQGHIIKNPSVHILRFVKKPATSPSAHRTTKHHWSCCSIRGDRIFGAD